jgi:hypothetical protein
MERKYFSILFLMITSDRLMILVSAIVRVLPVVMLFCSTMEPSLKKTKSKLPDFFKSNSKAPEHQ